MPFLFFGFVFAALFWILWAIAWVAVWPLAMVFGAVVLFRAVTRSSQRFAEAPPPAAGNTAFDDYRRETMSRLDEEQSKFREFLDRMRRSRDKQEFDRFMAERRPRPSLPAV